jgi:hypothetical protein
MPDYVLKANIAHYKKLIGSESDPKKLETLASLLAEEESKLVDWRAKHARPRTGV